MLRAYSDKTVNVHKELTLKQLIAIAFQLWKQTSCVLIPAVGRGVYNSDQGDVKERDTDTQTEFSNL